VPGGWKKTPFARQLPHLQTLLSDQNLFERSSSLGFMFLLGRGTFLFDPPGFLLSLIDSLHWGPLIV
jgi:hypothetical protein